MNNDVEFFIYLGTIFTFETNQRPKEYQDWRKNCRLTSKTCPGTQNQTG